MKRAMCFILILTATSYMCFGQLDSINKGKKNVQFPFGIFNGVTINITKNLASTYNPISEDVPNVSQTNNTDRIYLNSFSTNFLIPYFGFEFNQSKRITHSFSTSYLQSKRINSFKTYYTDTKTRNIFHEYNMYYFFLANKSETILPFAGVTFSMSNKKIDGTFDYFYASDIHYRNVDKTNLFLIQLPIGIRFAKHNFFVQLNTTLTLLSYSVGSQNFTASQETTYYKAQMNNYSKVLFIDKLIKEEYFYQNVFEFNIGFRFK